MASSSPWRYHVIDDIATIYFTDFIAVLGAYLHADVFMWSEHYTVVAFAFL